MLALTHSPRNTSLGGITILTCTLLMALISMAILYLNRGIISDQQIASNQTRAAIAAEAAEAGIEWAIGMLNAPNTVDGSCNLHPTTAAIAFRDIYALAATTPSTAPSCKIFTQNRPTTLQCSCPNPSPATLTNNALPGFSVLFNKIASDPDVLEIVATGCSEFSGVCSMNHIASSNTPDAIARIQTLVKLRPLLRSSPSAAMTCAGICFIEPGTLSITNTSMAANGILVNAGASAPQLPASAITLPGTPPENAIITGDTSLSQLEASDPTCARGEVFKAFFGTSIDDYKNSPSVFPLPVCAGTACETAIKQAIIDGWRNFYFPDGIHIVSTTSLGNQNDPITIVADGISSIGINPHGNADIFGLLFFNRGVSIQGTAGDMKIRGGLMSCSDIYATGNLSIIYDYSVVNAARRTAGLYTKIPGSWSALQ
jgi:hypothetical protein